MHNQPAIIKEHWFPASLFTLLLSLPLAVLLLIASYFDRTTEINQARAESTQMLDALHSETFAALNTVLSDLLQLADDRTLFSGTDIDNARLSIQFMRIAKFQDRYYQLRYIDTNGQELVRVNHDNGALQKTPHDQLQDKSHRNYFNRTLALDRGSVYISRFDLNIENGQLETPYHPVIRYATPVFNLRNQKTGILIFNYEARELISFFDRYQQQTTSSIYLLNPASEYLFHKDKNARWGFAIVDRPTFALDHPQAWPVIQQDKKGEVISNNYLYNYKKIRLDHIYNRHTRQIHDIHIAADEDHWTLISTLPETAMTAASDERRNYFILLLLVTVAFIFFSRLYWLKMKSQRSSLHYDNRLFRQAIEQSDELIYFTDNDGRISYVNPAVCQHTGYEQQELVGKTPDIFKSGKQSATFYQRLWKTIRDGHQFQSIFVNKRKDGELYYEAKVITPLKDQQGQIIAFVSTGKALTSQTRSLSGSNLSSRIAGGISHHFGNLIYAISGFINLLIDKKYQFNEEDRSRYLSYIQDSTSRAEELVQTIRLLAIDKDYALQQCSVNKVIRDALLQWSDSQQEHTHISLNLGDNLAQIYCDEEHLQQALIAAFNNAQQSFKDSGTIDITTSLTVLDSTVCDTCHTILTGQYIEICINDNGHGIEAEIIEDIWDPFFSTRESANLVAATPGLGLPTIRSLIHNMNGHIRLNSNDNGTSLHFYFTIAAKENKPADTKQPG